jgi:hypothetical protein
MVTGCDNLLDDEYKKTLDTDIPRSAYRFRSVMDIMVSDRVLFQILFEYCQENNIIRDKMTKAMTVSIKTMTLSGMQEASEETGITTILQPDHLLKTVHHYKTGILFTCPWDIPMIIEDIQESDIKPLKDGLYDIGMGCQIMDDMVDFMSDLERKRHNYLVSLFYYSPHAHEKRRIEKLMRTVDHEHPMVDLSKDFPESLAKASEASRNFLESGLNRLFSPQHRFLVVPTIEFLKRRIGAAHPCGYKDDEI